MSGAPDELRELHRQQSLLQALLSRGVATSAEPAWPMHGQSPDRWRRGLQAYVANAGASAERALRAAFPTLAAMLGDEPFAALARAFWQAHPPQRGDLGLWGDGLAGFIEADASLADWPYLADSARLDWLLAQAERAADCPLDAASLNLLAEADPSTLRLDFPDGTALLRSRHPVVTLWQAHQGPSADLGPARAALAEGRAECALVWRQGWRACVQAIDAPTARWTEALLRGDTVGEALTAAGEAFDFEGWLVQALRQDGLCRFRPATFDLPG